jgi:hypothetical protein
MKQLPPFAAIEPSLRSEPVEIEVASDATPLEFLAAVYRNRAVPLSVRMRAAIEAAPYVHPKLSVQANIVAGFASRMERIAEARGRSNVLDAKPIAAQPSGD